MKKRRGLKRYFRNLEVQNDLTKIKWLNINDLASWESNFHLHFDNKGYGNTSFKKRKPHLDKLFRHFDWLSDNLKLNNSEYQLYAVILDYNSSADALFLHQPNVGNSQFPFKIDSLSTISTFTNKPLNDYIDALCGYIKLYGSADEAFCLLYIKGIGKAFNR